ncbi:MAG: flippase-like domain-containing protein [Planctomycetales bacterium]|nr:flippase-like domain-containing protein [Planctomycetales bacterium]
MTNAKQPIRRAFIWVLAIAIGISIAAAFRSYQHQLPGWQTIHVGLLLTAVGLCLVYRIANALGWNLVLRSLGRPVAPLSTLRIWLTSEACRWLPGSLWSYGSRAVQAKRLGLENQVIGASLITELLITIAAWTATAAVGLMPYQHCWSQAWNFASLSHWRYIAMAIVAVAALLVTKPIRSRIVAQWQGLQSRLRQVAEVSLNRREIMRTGMFFFVLCTFNGVAFYVTILAVSTAPAPPLLAVIGANAFAWLVGFFAIFAPGGLVVREGTLAAILLPWLPMPTAIAASILWRVIQIVVELTCLGIVGGWDAVQPHRTLFPFPANSYHE